MEVTVRDNPDRSRYEARAGGELAGFAAYRLRGQEVVFTHTVVQPAYEGKGVASTLVAAALADVASRGLAVVPLCPFVRGWLDRHPERAATIQVRQR